LRLDATAGEGGGDDKGGEGGDKKPPEGGDKGDGEKGKQKPDDSEGRISELAKQNKELKAAIKAREDADKAAEDDKAKKKGDYEKLLSERDAELADERKVKTDYEAKLAKYEADAQKRIDEGLKGITDAERQKSAKAMLEGRTLEDQVALLPEVMKLAGAAASTFGAATPESKIQGAPLDAKKTRFAELNEKQKKSPLTPQERFEKNTLMVELGKVWEQEQEKKKAA